MLRQLCIIVTVRHIYLLLQFCSPFNAHWHFLIFFAAEHPPSRGQSIRITVVCSGSCMASFLTPPWLRCSHGKGAIPSFYFWDTGSLCLKERHGRTVREPCALLPLSTGQGTVLCTYMRTVQFYSIPCYLLVNIAKAQRILMPLQFILHRYDQK